MYLFRVRFKRVFDFSMAFLALMLLWPLLLILAFLVRVNMGSPILFKQDRPGLHGSPFRLYKFRSMRTLKQGESMLASDAQRLTSFGRFLRATSLDELPSLWCVLLGTMSFVGPRPLLMEYLARYSPEQARRHLVKPGITGYAQVHGRNDIDWDQRLALDAWYVDHQNWRLDLWILWRTISIVFSRKGVSSAGSVTMSEFKGTIQ